MGQFTNLNDSDLRKAMADTNVTIQRGYDFLHSLNGRENLGLTSMAQSTVKLLEVLEQEKQELEAEHDRRTA